jgi:hypothetical protein
MFTAPVLALLLAAPGDAYTLQWKLREGDVFYNKTAITLDQTIELMGQKVDQTISTKMVIRFTVKSARDGVTVVEMTYLDVKVDAVGLPGSNIADNLKGVSFTATLDDKLKVTKLEGYDKLIDKLADGSDDQKKLMRAVMPELSIREMFGKTFRGVPEKPVAVGGTWKEEDKMALGPLGTVEAKSSMKLEGVKGDLATISLKGDLTYKQGDGADGVLPFKITKADLKADKFTGTHVFDMKVGRVTETKVDMEMSGTMTISIAGNTVDAKLVQKMKVVGVITDKNPIVD